MGVLVVGWVGLVGQIAQPANAGDARAEEYQLLEAVPLGAPEGHRLVTDVYQPKGQGAGPFPGVVFVHGGGWSGGSRLDNRRQAAYLAAHGYVTISIEYRLVPAHTPGDHYPEQMADCRAAIRWFLAHAAEYGLDKERMGLAGISAGGHLVSMLGLGLGLERPDPAVKAVVSMSGVYDLDDAAQSGLLVSIGGLMGRPCAEDPGPCRVASPVDHVHAGAPPFLVMHGTADPLARTENARLFVEKMTAAGNHVETFWAKGSGHPFWHEEPWILPVEETMVKFLDQFVKGAP